MMRQLLLPIGLLACSALHAQTNDSWKKFDFLMGDWVGMAGEKDTPLGPGEGAYSFHAELNGKILVRRNAAHYDSGAQHDDLMIVYVEDAPRAIYFDSEGHVIRYNVTFPSANRVVFESDGTEAGPRYRLTYWLEGASLNGEFEIAANKSESYKKYMNWTSRKR